MIEDLPPDFSENVQKAMLAFMQHMFQEKDNGGGIALGIHYLLISFYEASGDPDWKKSLLKHLKQLLEDE